MGILNLTPDSFSDGGELFSGGKPDLALVMERAQAMVEAGASFLDLGGESTRPGAARVSPEEESDRVLPVVEALAGIDAVLSVDTSNPALILACAQAGAGLINDVRALGTPGALEAAAATGLPVCLMHMQGQPATMQQSPRYADVAAEVTGFLQERIAACAAAGIGREKLIIDPGFGFGKTLEHNLQLLAHLDRLKTLQLPILAGLSRKRMLGTLTGKSEKERVHAGVAAATLAVMKGASIVRTHDVGATADAMKVCREVLAASTVR